LSSSIQKAFDLQFLFADAVCLIPMYLRIKNGTIAQPYRGGAFELSPAACAVNLPQTSDLTDGRTDGDYLYISDLTDYFEMHVNASIECGLGLE
jgi:hypothetical protein